jgi:hypothetical protein
MSNVDVTKDENPEFSSQYRFTSRKPRMLTGQGQAANMPA